jgi:para-aminobenzoate synthetase component 1
MIIRFGSMQWQASLKTEMIRQQKYFQIESIHFKEKFLKWISKFNVACVLNSNHEQQLFSDWFSTYNFIAGVDLVSTSNEFMKPASDTFENLKYFHDEKNDWLFGFLTYDLKNELEDLASENKDKLNFPAVYFFQPRYVFIVEEMNLTIEYLPEFDNDLSLQSVVEEIVRTPVNHDEIDLEIFIQHAVTKTDYISTVQEIKKHIQRGDIYEMNYCIEFFSEGAHIQPDDLYTKLNAASPMPFSCFLKMNQHFLSCASPERFLAKKGNRIVSQPMKGTAARGFTKEEDESNKRNLRSSTKEQSENVMIVDLVRNDLSRTAEKGSVIVSELFGVYTFPKIHQMISTVECKLKEGIHFTDAIRYAFPMGSMTGAPKFKAMQLIEEYESTKRGLYSGSVGYITPGGDFDLNVVIRSILFNAEKSYLSFMTGSAITAQSDPEAEYEECLLKARSMLKLFNASLPVAG